ncbi:MAG: peptidase, partial [Oleispira antarctica]|nr:peptidase [Oleispira antarctica]MBQ0790922.1 peptidase [Oleispira antarctica]
RDLVTSIWIGFDQPSTLGRWTFGGNTALPIWVDFMRVALSDKPQKSFPQPDGIVNVRIDPDTGLLARPGQANAIFELFKQEQLPPESSTIDSPELDDEKEGAPQMLF